MSSNNEVINVQAFENWIYVAPSSEKHSSYTLTVTEKWIDSTTKEFEILEILDRIEEENQEVHKHVKVDKGISIGYLLLTVIFGVWSLVATVGICIIFAKIR